MPGANIQPPSPEEVSYLKMAAQYLSGAALFLIGVVYKKHDVEIAEMKYGQKTLWDAVSEKVDRADYREDIAKVVDKIDKHAADSQLKFDKVMSAIHQYNLSTMSELGKKQDKH